MFDSGRAAACAADSAFFYVNTGAIPQPWPGRNNPFFDMLHSNNDIAIALAILLGMVLLAARQAPEATEQGSTIGGESSSSDDDTIDEVDESCADDPREGEVERDFIQRLMDAGYTFPADALVYKK